MPFWSSQQVRCSAETHIFHAYGDVQRNLNFPARPVVLNLFETVAQFVFFKSLHGPLLCGPPLLDHSSVALRLEKRGLHF